MTENDVKSILLVEDSLDQANLMMRWLELAGDFRITHAQDGVRGAALAQEQRWDLVITDLNLPGSDGIEVIRASKALHPETPVLVVTAYKDQTFAARAIREGADGFLPKPFDRETLSVKASELLRSGGTSHHAEGPTILAIGAHPDDVENGCGGALLRHLDLGNRVIILVLTQGEEDGSPSERTGEVELSARLMGARTILGDLPATEVTDSEEAIQVIERVVQAFEPDIVYTHTPHDLNSDHRGAYRATLIAAREAPTVYCYPSKTSSVDFKPGFFVEVTEYLERKKEIVSLFQTPEANRPYLKGTFVEASAVYWGRFAGFGKVEPMEVVRGAR